MLQHAESNGILPIRLLASVQASERKLATAAPLQAENGNRLHHVAPSGCVA